MKYFVITFSTLLLVSCLPEQQRKQIVVDSEATIEVPPDAFKMNAYLRVTADNRDAVLSGISELMDEVSENLPALEGLNDVKIQPTEINVSPVREAECVRERYDDNACPIIGYLSEIELHIDGAPAEMAGNALSFLSDLGAEEVGFEEYYIRDLAAVNDRAREQALKNARTKAESIANNMGVTITGVVNVRMVDTVIFSSGFAETEDRIVVTGSRIARNQLNITPAPIEIERDVVVTFEIE